MTDEAQGEKGEENGQAGVIEAGVREEDKLTQRKNGMLLHLQECGYV